MRISPYHFFLAHAGYSYSPNEKPIDGRRRCAKALAHAEQQLLASEFQFVTEDDDERAYCYCGDPTCRYREGSDYDYPTVCARIVKPCPDHGLDCRHAQTLVSLGAIMDPDENYLRVIRAELASEIF